jgi:hypothetical protein
MGLRRRENKVADGLKHKKKERGEGVFTQQIEKEAGSKVS